MATVVPEDAVRAVDEEMQNDNARETEVRVTGDGFADEVASMQEDGMVEPAPADGTRQTEVFAIDQQDSASGKDEGDVEEPDGVDDDDKENGGDVANRPNLVSGAEEQYYEGQEWSGFCDRQGHKVTRSELFANVNDGTWGAADVFRSDGQSVSNEMLGNTMVQVQELMAQAGVDWQEMSARGCDEPV